MDYRLKENRKEGFIKWFIWSVKNKDCDPSVWLTNYLNERYEHNQEEKLWLCWLYANTYQMPTAWVLKNEFPDYELVDQVRIDRWNEENYRKLRYQTDTKWNKGHLPKMFASYKENVGDKTQKEFFENLYGDNEQESFDNTFKYVKENFFKFGRYSTWFYLQHLKQTAGVKIEPTSLMLSDYSGSQSHRNGLLYAIGEEELVDKKLTSAQYSRLEEISLEIMQECKRREPSLSLEFDAFNMETCLCSFKKIFRENHGRYLGYYLDRQSEEIQVAENDGWYGICWDVIWQARNETLNPLLSGRRNIQKERFSYFLNTGIIDSEDLDRTAVTLEFD